jgi:hypothetical protein
MLARAHDAEDGEDRGSGKRLAQRTTTQPLSAIGRNICALWPVLCGPPCAPGSCFNTPRGLLSCSIERCNHASATANQRVFTSGEADCFAIARQTA